MTEDEAYSVLGLRPGATLVDVRRAFKRRALAHHPDRNPSQTDATTTFRRIVVAYEILNGQRASAPEVASDRVDDPFAERGEGPMHYPTAEEIRNLGNEATHPGKMVDRLFLIFVALVLLWTILGRLAPRALPAEDPKHETTP